MSATLSKAEILFLQRFAKVAGLYKGPLDGKFSAQVGDAEEALKDEFEKIRKSFGEFDSRSEKNIQSLLPEAQRKAREFLHAAPSKTLSYRIISGTRTFAEQDALFAKGRTAPGPKVTNARGGQSNHNFGIAWDVGIFDGKTFFTGKTKAQSKAYVDLADTVMTKVKGLEWGGHFKSIKDTPHYQVATGKSATQIRKLFQAGEKFT